MMKPFLRILYIWALLISALPIIAIDVDREFRVINAANDLADNSAQIIACTRTGRMIISTLGNVNFYDGSSFTHIDTRQEYQYPLPLYSGNDHLYFDRFHHMWLKFSGSMTCVDLMREQFVTNVDSLLKTEFQLEKEVSDIFIDRDGYPFFQVNDVLYSVKTKQNYQLIAYRDLQDVEVIDDRLYTFYDNGVEVAIDMKTGKIVHQTKAFANNDDASLFNKSSLLIDYEDKFYQIRNGEHKSVLLEFNRTTLQWSQILEVDYHLNNLCIQEGILYLACNYGYWVYDLKTGDKRHVNSLKLVGSGRELETNCNVICFDKQGGMWIGTQERGLLYAKPYKPLFNAYPWSNPLALEYARQLDDLQQNITTFRGMQTNCLFKDSRGWSWFGTVMGLYLFRTPQSDPIIFNRKKGLLNNVIHSVVEDQDHNIWVSTSCGITCIIIENDQPVFVNSFNQQDNVPNESFLNCKAKCLEDGKIVMQAIDHVVVFHPRDFVVVNGKENMKLYPKLIRLLVNGYYVYPDEEVGGNVIIDRAITRAKDISLNADQNSLSLTFSGLNYSRPFQTFYKVRIKELEDDWTIYSYASMDGIVDSRGMLHLPLTGLRPGDYTIEMQASMKPEVWEGEPFSWVIHVNQPWWQTSAVYVILGLIVLLMLAVNFFVYNRNMSIRATLNSGEGDMVRKIVNFIERSQDLLKKEMVPTIEDATDGTKDSRNVPTPEFVDAMTRLIPYVLERKNARFSMHQLSTEAGVDVARFYDIISGNLYKPPRSLSRMLRLRKAAELLRTSNLSIEKIADECGFYTPNFFIGNFFHEYKMTPIEYRREHAEI